MFYMTNTVHSRN